MVADDFKALAETYGTPLYVFDEEEFTDNYRELVGAFQAVYPRYRLSYSYKTNYTPYICALVKRLGGYAEVVSDMEYEVAERLGYDASHIVYNGPAKGAAMERHLLNGGISNIDNVAEAARVCALADANRDKTLAVGLRVNLDLGRGYYSRFGTAPHSPEMEEIVRMLSQWDNIALRGLHCHIGHSRDLAAWARRTEIMLGLADELFGERPPAYISLGSGMFGRMAPDFAAQFNADIPGYRDYAQAVLKPFAGRYGGLPEEEQPIVFTEPGATLISKYVYFLTAVLDIKNILGRDIATVDGSFYNLGEICRGKQLPLEWIPGEGKRTVYDAVDITGYTCLENDVLYRGYKGALGVGDRLVFGNVGGYSVVSKPPFIHPNCAMVARRADGSVRQIMRAESFDDLFSKFSFE